MQKCIQPLTIVDSIPLHGIFGFQFACVHLFVVANIDVQDERKKLS